MLFKIKTSAVVEAFKLIKLDDVSNEETEKHVEELHVWLRKNVGTKAVWEGFDGGIYLNNDYHDTMSEEGLACHQGDYLVAWAPGYVLPMKGEVFESLVETE